MTFFRQYLAPFLVVLLFLVALIAVSARIFLPEDMAQPAPIAAAPWHAPIASSRPDSLSAAASPAPEPSASLGTSLSLLVNGLPADLAAAAQM